MNKLYVICFCIITVLLSACGPSLEESKKEERQKNIMGDGKLKNLPPGKHLGGL